MNDGGAAPRAKPNRRKHLEKSGPARTALGERPGSVEFSATFWVDDARPWPGRHRFDFLVRTRPATEAEIALAKQEEDADYPQRAAVRFALQELAAVRTEETAKTPE